MQATAAFLEISRPWPDHGAAAGGGRAGRHILHLAGGRFPDDHHEHQPGGGLRRDQAAPGGAADGAEGGRVDSPSHPLHPHPGWGLRAALNPHTGAITGLP